MRVPTVERATGHRRWLVLLLLGCVGAHATQPVQAQPAIQLPPGTPSPQATGAPPGAPVPATQAPNAQVPPQPGWAPQAQPQPQLQSQPQPQAQAVPIPAPAPAPPQGATMPRPATPPLPPVTAAAPRPPLPPAAPAPPTPPVKGLPPGSPSLAIQGAAWSADPQLRRLIVNNQVVREGADLGGGVQLRQIGPDAAVLAVRGTDYTVRY